MDQAQFEALVHRMEQQARRAPTLYRMRVLGLAALGYAYLAFVVGALLAIAALCVLFMTHSALLAGKLLFVVVPILAIVLRSLWVRLGTPTGHRLSPHDCPRLCKKLGALRARLNTPRIHEVLITSEFNAAVCQIPRLGLFGWHRNYLMLGLPLLKSLTVPQFEAVLAHELGHLSRGHARTANWIYCMRLVWQRLGSAIEANPRAGTGFILEFFKWYVPYFNACSFPFARQNELEADASAVQLTSSSSAAQALTSVSVISRYLNERYWPTIHAAARDVPQPAFAPYKALTPESFKQIDAQEAQRWLKDELSLATTYADTHPALKDRLAAMGAQAELAFPAEGAAADQLLGAKRTSLEEAFDAEWRRKVEPSWAQFYADTQKRRERLAVLRQPSSGEPPSVDDMLELAVLEEDLGAGAEAALALRRQAADSAPDSMRARFALSRQLLLRDDEAGIKMMESVIDAEPDAIVAGSELLRNYWWKRGNREQAKRWHERAVDRARALDRL